MSEMPSHFEAVCPNCQAGLRIPLSYSGSNVRCKHCEHKFLVKKIEGLPAQIGYADPESNLVDRPSGQPEGPQSADAEPRTAEQQPESAGELAAIREENERLGARLKTLEQDHAGIQSERDLLLVQLEELRGDHARLRSEHEQDRQEQQKLRDE
ncbi:MAG: MJ0042-type zinc finger domain-containing protein, partial [Isosphaeraceae bacterium]